MTEPLKLDPKNSRTHSPQNRKAIRTSLETVGAFRSIGAVRGTVKVGNGVFQEAQDLGFEILHVKAKPNQLVCVDRDDLDDAQADQAANLDNIVADSNAFAYEADRLRDALANDAVSRAIAEQRDELRALLKAPPKEPTFKEYDESIADGVSVCLCPNCGHEHAKKD